MKTREENTKEFIAELNALLLKYKAEITIDLNFKGYVADPKIQLYINSYYDYNKDELIRESVDISLGDRLDGYNEIG